MSFTNIQLPASTIVELYKNSLVEINSKNQGTIQHLGNNLQKILVLVYYTNEVFLPGQQFEFLEKILSACKLNIGDIAIINRAKQHREIDEYLQAFGPKSVLIFESGVQGAREYPEMEFFTPVYRDGIILMCAPALEKLNEENNESKQLKARFWQSLKQFFSI